MSNRSRILVVALTLLVGLAGGGVATAVLVDDPAGAQPARQSSANATTTAIPSTGSADPVDDTETTRAASPVPPNGSVADAAYTDLYNRTIDSIVTVRVSGSSGGQGSGFVYDDRGHVVTNQHVVSDADQALVKFADGTWRTATVVGTDVYTDLAVLRVENVPSGIDPLPVADRNPRPGQRVAALGSPFGLDGSITSGIVSGVNRTTGTNLGFTIPATVQTDAPINPGNSGGPLVTLDGTVVGVNRAVEPRSDNIGYAISPQLIERVVPSLIANGSYEHSFVGIQSVPVTPPVAEANGLDRARGVLVTGVLNDGPADGVLQPANSRTFVDGQRVPTGGDVILSVAGAPVRTQQELSRVLMLNTRPGDTVSVTVLRDGERRTVELTLGERPSP